MALNSHWNKKIHEQTEFTLNKRNFEIVKVRDCMVEGNLIRIIWYYLY